MNQVYALRKREDLAKLRALRDRMPRTLEIVRESGDPPNWITLAIRIPTAPNQNYPREKQLVSEVDIKLPEQYPLKAGPMIVFNSPIWNPNVFDSGKWCYGDWSITENLEMLAIRLMQVIALDPAVINLKSAANREAAGWYHRIMQKNSRIFPTISVTGLMAEQQQKKKITWRTIQ